MQLQCTLGNLFSQIVFQEVVMRRNDNFGLRVSEIERAMIVDLAKRLRRSESDAVRLLVREAVKSLQAQDEAARDAAQQVGVIQDAIAG
jgi:predicted nucleic acid-binding protein